MRAALARRLPTSHCPAAAHTAAGGGPHRPHRAGEATFELAPKFNTLGGAVKSMIELAMLGVNFEDGCAQRPTRDAWLATWGGHPAAPSP